MERNAPSVIYAIEEPETSQHSENQKKMVRALSELSDAHNTQIIITTHSPTIVKQLAFSNIRIIRQDESQKVIENSLPNQLPYPSLNEINYLAFSEVSEEYHNELFGFIEEQGILQAFVQGQKTVTYNRLQKDKSIKIEQITLTQFIRHQIHHPENTHNARFTDADLIASIEAMRLFIQSQS